MIQAIDLEEDRFGFEPEVTAKIAARREWRVYEMGISYRGRTYAEGKKIGWRDGLRAVWCILKYSPASVRVRRLRRTLPAERSRPVVPTDRSQRDGAASPAPDRVTPAATADADASTSPASERG